MHKITKVERVWDGLQKIQVDRVIEKGNKQLRDLRENFQAELNSKANTFKMTKGRGVNGL